MNRAGGQGSGFLRVIFPLQMHGAGFLAPQGLLAVMKDAKPCLLALMAANHPIGCRFTRVTWRAAEGVDGRVKKAGAKCGGDGPLYRLIF